MWVRRDSTDAIVVGAGLIGMAVADALARRGTRVTLVGERRRGEASPAAAGMLAPTVEPLSGAALGFALESRERYPDFLKELQSRTGVAVALDRRGILELAHSDVRAAALRATVVGTEGLTWLGPTEVREVEPLLAPVVGAVFHPLDGAVDNVALVDALDRATGTDPRIRRISAAAAEVRRSAAGATVALETGQRLEAPVVILAAGAWSARLEGLPRPLPIEPGRGQMIALDAAALRHVVYAEHAYLVPRADGTTLVGATMERVGFDASTTRDALETLRRRGEEIVPSLEPVTGGAAWAGLRPMTPDGLPILGADPEWPALLYATGHSRNGILMAPLTGEAIAALACSEEPSVDLTPFDVRRFASGGAPWSGSPSRP